MQKHVRNFVEIAVKTLPLAAPVYEFGARHVQPEKPEADLRSLFAGREFVGCDFCGGPGVDRILDLHDIDLPDKSVGTVIALVTLEHVEYRRRAMSEIFRVLHEGGIAIVSSVMNFPIHGFPNDYWRFTPQGLRSLLEDFDDAFVGSCGSNPGFPQTIVGIGFKGARPDTDAFERAYSSWESWNNNLMTALKVPCA